MSKRSFPYQVLISEGWQLGNQLVYMFVLPAQFHVRDLD